MTWPVWLKSQPNNIWELFLQNLLCFVCCVRSSTILLCFLLFLSLGTTKFSNIWQYVSLVIVVTWKHIKLQAKVTAKTTPFCNFWTIKKVFILCIWPFRTPHSYILFIYASIQVKMCLISKQNNFEIIFTFWNDPQTKFSTRLKASFLVLLPVHRLGSFA